MPAITQRTFVVRDYDLAATLSCGQAFRWHLCGEAWVGAIGRRWVRLWPGECSITAEAVEPVEDWNWVSDYLQVGLDLDAVIGTFPDDEPMRAAVRGCRGLRLLRQDPWECLASFILSSTKQIVQIGQIVSRLCERYGEALVAPAGHPPGGAFPSPERLAGATEAELRACRMGFRATYLLGAARAIARGVPDLARLRTTRIEEARGELMELPGVGRKIADCVLLFAYGCQAAFPVDVWVMRALRRLYFPRRRVGIRRLHEFATSHFGPNAGYAQQYLFHYMRTKAGDRRQKTEDEND